MVGTGDTIRLGIERVVPGGDGMGRSDGRAVFVPASAPGDLLDVRVVGDKPGFLRAEIVGVIEPGPGRVAPTCPYYGECGGCNLQHLSYGAQLEAKLGIARDAWRRSGGLDGVEFDVVASEPFAYRNRAQFHVDGAGRACYARRASSELLAPRSCPILVEPLQRWIADGSVGIAPGKDRFVAFGYRDGAFIEGRDGELSVDVLGRPFRFDIGGFFQSNLRMVERLVPAVCSGTSGERAADLYCGVGLFGAFLKDGFSRLVCVEQDKRSVGYACANVGPGAGFSASSIEEWTRSAQARERYDYVVVDPPRAGLTATVRAWLAAARPAAIGYVSCDPVSLARDAGFLVKAGYAVESAALYDFYPQTSHVESYARFTLD